MILALVWFHYETEYVQLQNNIKIDRSLKLFAQKSFFFTSFSLLSIPIFVMEINGGYFPAICRLCLVIEMGAKLRSPISWSQRTSLSPLDSSNNSYLTKIFTLETSLILDSKWKNGTLANSTFKNYIQFTWPLLPLL